MLRASAKLRSSAIAASLAKTARSKSPRNTCTDLKLSARLTESGANLRPGTPEDFAQLIARETEKWGKVIRAAGVKAG